MIAKIHIDSFSDRALSQLGKEAVRRYYFWLLTGFPACYPICIVSPDNVITGYCFSGVYSGSFTGFLKRNKWYLLRVISLHPWLIFNPIVREQSFLATQTLLRLFRFRRISKTPPSVNSLTSSNLPKRKPWGILAIAVDPDFQRQGYAEAMMHAVEMYAKENHCNYLYLSVHTDNFPAVHFYEKMGWEKNPPGENWTGKMCKKLYE